MTDISLDISCRRYQLFFWVLSNNTAAVRIKWLPLLVWHLSKSRKYCQYYTVNNTGRGISEHWLVKTSCIYFKYLPYLGESSISKVWRSIFGEQYFKGLKWLQIFLLKAYGFRPYTIAGLKSIITYSAKLLNADWLKQRAFCLITRALLVNQQGMITSSWLAER